MSFDFDQVPSRRHTGSLKWDLPKRDDVIPLWVADMDFPACPSVREALQKRLDHGVFGYELIPGSWYEAVLGWQKERNGLELERSSILPVPGIVPAVSAALQALTLPGEQVVVQTPAYNCFFSSIRNAGLETVANPLKLENGRYVIDYELLERQLASPRARVLLLCNPHNPTGRLWTRGELERVGQLCLKHGVLVLSDEIHSDLRPRDSVFTPFISLGKEFEAITVTMNAPSKAFNMAGLQNAYMLIPNQELYGRVDRAVNINEICDVNPFGVEALTAAYTQGGPWLDELNAYLRGNMQAVRDFMKERLPRVGCYLPEATYLMWLDFGAYAMSSEELHALFVRHGVMLSAGTAYGKEGAGFMRLNVACTRKLLQQGLERIARALQA